MTVSTNSLVQFNESPVYSQTDAAELQRLSNLSPGLGEAIYDQDTEMESFINELGIR